MLTTIFVIFLISSIICNALNLTDRFGASVKRNADDMIAQSGVLGPLQAAMQKVQAAKSDKDPS